MQPDSQPTWSRRSVGLLLGIVVATAAWTMAGTARAGVAQTAGTPTATPAATPSRAPVILPPDDLAILHSQFSGGGGGSNVVNLVNRQDGQLRIRGAIQLNRIPGPTVAPVNDAEAFSSCTNCQSIAVALQINLDSSSATFVSPRNVAFAVNSQCTGCSTVALALQYVIPVRDPAQVPSDVMALIFAMDAEMKAIEHGSFATLADAEAAINGVVAQFSSLAQFLFVQRNAQSN